MRSGRSSACMSRTWRSRHGRSSVRGRPPRSVHDAGHVARPGGALQPDCERPGRLAPRGCGRACGGAAGQPGVGHGRRRRRPAELAGAIGRGCACWSASPTTTTSRPAAALAGKLWNLRIFADDAGAMNRSVADAGGEVLVVSQFTLYGDTSRGRRPSWVAAARPEQAEPLVDAVVAELRGAGRDGRDRPLPGRHGGRARQRRAGHPPAGGVTASSASGSASAELGLGAGLGRPRSPRRGGGRLPPRPHEPAGPGPAPGSRSPPARGEEAVSACRGSCPAASPTVGLQHRLLADAGALVAPCRRARRSR